MTSTPTLSRRDFLKLSGWSAIGLAAMPLQKTLSALSPYQQGRVLYDFINV